MALDEIEHDDFVGGRAPRIGIFLSVLNVHVDGVPCDARGIGLHYRNGNFPHPLRPESARQNEALEIRLEEPLFSRPRHQSPPDRRRHRSPHRPLGCAPATRWREVNDVA